MVRVVPRPARGSSTRSGPGLGLVRAANVRFISSLVNCSLVFPEYLGIVTRSSSHQSVRGICTGVSAGPAFENAARKLPLRASASRVSGVRASSCVAARYETPASVVGVTSVSCRAVMANSAAASLGAVAA